MIDVRFDRAAGVSAAFVRRVVCAVLRAERSKRQTVSTLVTDDRAIRALNKKFLRHDYATDVISFWIREAELGEKESGYLGDLVVSLQTARSKAKELGIGWREELARYLVHGTLHLLGYEDESPAKKKKMTARQESLLKKILA